jgi:hypothetical protein
MSNYMTEFPDYDDTLILPEGWQDISWHNDARPCFENRIGEIAFVIFCDYKDSDRREMKGEPRFVVYLEDPLNFVCINQSETLAEALEFIDKQLEL